MPELPDLQAFSQNLQRRLAGKQVVGVQLNSKKSNVTAAELEKVLKGKIVEAVYREGKQLRIKFSENVLLGLHLMLHGELHLVQPDELLKFSVFELSLDHKEKFVMSDFQKQARPTLNPEPSNVPDALSDLLNVSYLKSLLSGKKAIIKNVLLDQDVIRGIGNAYADEILWHARISPYSVSAALPDVALRKLDKSIKHVLEQAIQKILAEQPDIISGELRDFMVIHQSKNPESPTGHKIEIKKNGARKTYFTDEQVLYEL
jgi:formamidopyrimidine-DNA glycosylase